MRLGRLIVALLGLSALLGAVAANSPGDVRGDTEGEFLSAGAVPVFDGSISVMTYNVKGLPWPVATGRSTALAAIAIRLRGLRFAGRAPQVVVLQEAFTAEAHAMGAAAGYRYVADGLSMEPGARRVACG